MDTIFMNSENTKTSKVNLKYQLQLGTKHLNYLTDHIVYQIFKIVSRILLKTWTVTDDLPVRTYINKIENRIKFEIGYYLELFMPKIMKLLGSTKSKITNNENGKMFLI